MELNRVIQIRVSDADMEIFFRLAAQRSVDEGKRISIGDTVRQLARREASRKNKSLLNHGDTLHVQLKPAVKKVLEQNGTTDVSQYINKLVMSDMAIQIGGEQTENEETPA